MWARARWQLVLVDRATPHGDRPVLACSMATSCFDSCGDPIRFAGLCVHPCMSHAPRGTGRWHGNASGPRRFCDSVSSLPLFGDKSRGCREVLRRLVGPLKWFHQRHSGCRTRRVDVARALGVRRAGLHQSRSGRVACVSRYRGGSTAGLVCDSRIRSARLGSGSGSSITPRELTGRCWRGRRRRARHDVPSSCRRPAHRVPQPAGCGAPGHPEAQQKAATGLKNAMSTVREPTRPAVP